MKISEALIMLRKLQDKHGDIEVEADCAFCGKSTHVDTIAVAPETAQLKGKHEKNQ